MSTTGNDYEPWASHEAFIDASSKAQPYSLVDPQRLWELWTLVAQAEDGAIVEIGVCNGGSLALIGLAAKYFAKPIVIFGFDTFEGCVLAGPNDPVYVGGEHKADQSTVAGLISRLGLDEFVSVISGEFPGSASAMDLSTVALAHIDVDTYQSAKNCTEFLWPKLRIGGVLVFDDYGYSQCLGVTKYVNELWPREDLIFVHNLNGHGLIIKTR